MCRLGRSTPATADRSRCACSVHRATGGPGTMAFTRSSRGAHDSRAHAVPTMLGQGATHPPNTARRSTGCPPARWISGHRPVRGPFGSFARSDASDSDGPAARLRRVMRVMIMGCGRVGSELSEELLKAATTWSSSTRSRGVLQVSPGAGAKTVVGLGFDRDVLEEAGIKEADAFVAVSSGDNSNIVSARVALEHYHVPKVVARIYDPRRAEIYERLNIPTVATVAWGIKQIQLMLFHDRKEIRERSPAASSSACACRCRRTWSAIAHVAERRGQDARGRRLARRGRVHPDQCQHAAGGRLPGLMMTKDGGAAGRDAEAGGDH